MKKILILSVFSIISYGIFCQTGQINGFKDFKLNSALSNYPKYKFKEHKEFGDYEQHLTCYKVLNTPVNLKVGKNSVIGIYLYCYQNLIVRIDVKFNSFSYEELQQMFGEPNKEKHFRSENISNGQESASWEIPNSIIQYHVSWYTKEVSADEYVLRRKTNQLTFNFATYEYKLSFRSTNYESIIKSAQDNETKNSLNDFNSPIN